MSAPHIILPCVSRWEYSKLNFLQRFDLCFEGRDFEQKVLNLTKVPKVSRKRKGAVQHPLRLIALHFYLSQRWQERTTLSLVQQVCSHGLKTFLWHVDVFFLNLWKHLSLYNHKKKSYKRLKDLCSSCFTNYNQDLKVNIFFFPQLEASANSFN